MCGKHSTNAHFNYFMLSESHSQVYKKELAAKDYCGRAVADGFGAREFGISLYCQGWTGQKMQKTKPMEHGSLCLNEFSDEIRMI